MVVIELDAEDNHRANCGDDIGDYQRPVIQDKSLNDKEDRAEPEHAESGQGDAIGVASADSDDSLRQVAEYHADTGGVADDCNPCFAHSVCIVMIYK